MVNQLTKAFRPIGRLFKSPKNFAVGLRKGLNTLRDTAGEVAGITSVINPELGASLMAAKEGFGAAGRVADSAAKMKPQEGGSMTINRPSASDVRAGLKAAVQRGIQKPVAEEAAAGPKFV
jgi:hypothetical protein